MKKKTLEELRQERNRSTNRNERLEITETIVALMSPGHPDFEAERRRLASHYGVRYRQLKIDLRRASTFLQFEATKEELVYFMKRFADLRKSQGRGKDADDLREEIGRFERLQTRDAVFHAV